MKKMKILLFNGFFLEFLKDLYNVSVEQQVEDIEDINLSWTDNMNTA